MEDENLFDRGRAEPLVSYFAIENLYGYRTLSLESPFAATVLIARNGSGKTTLLATLDAVLKGQFSRLSELKFDRIICRLRDITKDLVITSEDIAQYNTVRTGTALEIEARRLNTNPIDMIRYLEGFDQLSYDSSVELSTSLWRRHSFIPGKTQQDVERIRDLILDRTPNLKVVSKNIRQALNGVEVVYLPTYRRLEVSLPAEEQQDRLGRPAKPFRANKTGLHSAEIRFGLGDIPERLGQLNSTIMNDSNQGFRGISAKIIAALLDGSFDRMNIELGVEPTKQELSLFFSRLKEGGRRYNQFFDLSDTVDLEKLFSERSLSNESNKFLSFFLSQLNIVISATRETERLVQTFVDRCNFYLSAQDDSVVVASQPRLRKGADDKELKLSRTDLSVSVWSKSVKVRIPLDSLSSGEKQMISLLGKLYLYPQDKLVLIDEPELSLSMDWQRKILLDVIGAPLCKQMIAITHSPFVFENALDPFARALSVKIDSSRLVEATSINEGSADD